MLNQSKSESLVWHNDRRTVRELLPYEYNPRILTEKAAAHLKASLSKFNLVEVPAVDVDNRIIAGHQRVKILMLLGRGDEEIDVRMPNRKLTGDEFREYCIRSNKNVGEFDFDVLSSVFEVDELLSWGFSEAELDMSEPLPPENENESGDKEHTCPKCGNKFTEAEEG